MSKCPCIRRLGFYSMALLFVLPIVALAGASALRLVESCQAERELNDRLDLIQAEFERLASQQTGQDPEELECCRSAGLPPPVPRLEDAPERLGRIELAMSQLREEAKRQRDRARYKFERLTGTSAPR